jgi:hypothetical protein
LVRQISAIAEELADWDLESRISKKKKRDALGCGGERGFVTLTSPKRERDTAFGLRIFEQRSKEGGQAECNLSLGYSLIPRRPRSSFAKINAQETEQG